MGIELSIGKARMDELLVLDHQNRSNGGRVVDSGRTKKGGKG